MPTLIPPLPPLICFLYLQRNPVANHRIHNHIEDGGWQWFTLCRTSSALKGGPVISSRLCHHCQLPQYVLRSHLALVPTPHPSKITRHLDLSKASYALCRSRNITYRTSSFIAASCYNSLASRVAVPVPRPAQNSCRKSWYVMEVASRRCKIVAKNFHITSTSSITLYFFRPSCKGVLLQVELHQRGT